MNTNYFLVAQKRVACWLPLVLAFLTTNTQLRAQAPPAEAPFDIIYASLAHKVLLHGKLQPFAEMNRFVVATNSNEGLEYFKEGLSKQGYNLVPDGEKFDQVLPKSEGMKPRTAPLLHGPNTGNVANDEINFHNIDLGTFLEVFSGLSGRTLIRPSSLPAVNIALCTYRNPLTQDELLHAICIVLSLNGFAIVEDGGKFAWIVPAANIGLVHANAPKPEPGASLIDPANVPVIKPAPPALPNLPRPVGAPPPPPTSVPATLDDLMRFCATQQGKTFQSSAASANQNIIFKVQTSLTKDELLYAVESTLGLNGLAIVPVDNKTIRLGSVSERQTPAKQP